MVLSFWYQNLPQFSTPQDLESIFLILFWFTFQLYLDDCHCLQYMHIFSLSLTQARRNKDPAKHFEEGWPHSYGSNQQDWKVLWAQVWALWVLSFLYSLIFPKSNIRGGPLTGGVSVRAGNYGFYGFILEGRGCLDFSNNVICFGNA